MAHTTFSNVQYQKWESLADPFTCRSEKSSTAHQWGFASCIRAIALHGGRKEHRLTVHARSSVCLPDEQLPPVSARTIAEVKQSIQFPRSPKREKSERNISVLLVDHPAVTIHPVTISQLFWEN